MAADAHDLREGGTWTPLQRAKNDLIFVLVSIVLAVATRLPAAMLRVIGAATGAIAYFVGASGRRRARENLARAGLERGVALRAYCNLGRELGDAIAHLNPMRNQAPLPFAPGAREVFDDAVKEGRGVVFASAHLAPWERVAVTLVAAGIPLTVVAREPYDPRFRKLYDRLREARGVATVYRGASGAGAALLRVLRKGRVLGIPMDLASRVASIDAPFLGGIAPTPIGPARLALRTGAVVIVGTAAPLEKDAGRRSISIAAARIETDDLSADDAGERELTKRINDALSARIRAFPEAWPWMHDRKLRPLT